MKLRRLARDANLHRLVSAVNKKKDPWDESMLDIMLDNLLSDAKQILEKQRCTKMVFIKMHPAERIEARPASR